MTLTIHVLTTLIGFVLMKGFVLVWLAGWFPWVKTHVEQVFTPGEDLFAQGASYTSTVFFFRWYGFVFGLFLFLPRFVVLDIIVAAIAVLLWRYLARRASAALNAV